MSETSLVPFSRTAEVHALFCREIASRKSLRQTCTDNGWAIDSFTAWHHDDPTAAARYARATEARMDVLADELIDLADSAQEPSVMGMDGEDIPIERVDPARVNAIKLAVDTRKWIMSKLHRTKYGDQPASISVTNAVQINNGLTDEQQAALIADKRAANERMIAVRDEARRLLGGGTEDNTRAK